MFRGSWYTCRSDICRPIFWDICRPIFRTLAAPFFRTSAARTSAAPNFFFFIISHRYGQKKTLEVIKDVVVVNKVLEEDNKVVEEVNKKLVKEYNDFFEIFQS